MVSTLLCPWTLLPSVLRWACSSYLRGLWGMSLPGRRSTLSFPSVWHSVWKWRTWTMVDSHSGKQGPNPSIPQLLSRVEVLQRDQLEVAKVALFLCLHYELGSLILHGVSCEALSVFNFLLNFSCANSYQLATNFSKMASNVLFCYPFNRWVNKMFYSIECIEKTQILHFSSQFLICKTKIKWTSTSVVSLGPPTPQYLYV